MSEDVKIAVLMEKTRGQLQEHLRQNASALNTYQGVKDVTVNCPKTKQISSKDPSKDPDAMEIGTVSKGRGKGIGKAKGSKGKNQDITCCKCGGQGHMAPQ